MHLLVLSRARRKAPNLQTSDRFLLGALSLLVSPRRLFTVAKIIKPATLLKIHRALVKRKYRRLVSNKGHRQFGPKGPSKELIAAIVELKQRNRRYGCPRIAYIITLTFGSHPPRYLSSNNDPLIRFHRWRANLRILNVEEIKSMPYVPLSHPFIERLIGTIRHEFLNHVPFWNSLDLEPKLGEFKDCYNNYRTHSALSGESLGSYSQLPTRTLADINGCTWQ